MPGLGKLAGSRRGTGPHPFAHCGSAFRSSPRGPVPFRSRSASWSTPEPGGSKKRHVVSHLDLDSAGCKTAFPVSRETALHVGLTLGRGDVTAHASRQRGSWAPLPLRGASNAQRKRESSWRGLRKGLVLRAKGCERLEKGRDGRGGRGQRGAVVATDETEGDLRSPAVTGGLSWSVWRT